jgi:hypothetical protein
LEGSSISRIRVPGIWAAAVPKTSKVRGGALFCCEGKERVSTKQQAAASSNAAMELFTNTRCPSRERSFQPVVENQ